MSKRLKCNNCDYIWEFKGEHKFFATCPRCMRKVSLKSCEVKEE